MANTTVTLPMKKETKNMLQFQCPDDDKHTAAIPTLYVRKDQFDSNQPWPVALKITVEAMAK